MPLSLNKLTWLQFLMSDLLIHTLSRVIKFVTSYNTVIPKSLTKLISSFVRVLYFQEEYVKLVFCWSTILEGKYLGTHCTFEVTDVWEGDSDKLFMHKIVINIPIKFWCVSVRHCEDNIDTVRHLRPPWRKVYMGSPAANTPWGPK